MTIKIDKQEAEVIDHMRHVSPLGREQIVWRAWVIRKAESCLKAIREEREKTEEGKNY